MSFPKYPKYKDSGLEWLGEVPEHWGVLPLKKRFQIVGGSTPSSDNGGFWDGDVLWATPADLSGRASLYIDDTQRKITEAGLKSCAATIVPENTVILSTRAPIGSLAITKAAMCTNQGCKSLVPNHETDAKYFAYLLSITSRELNVRGKGTTFLELSSDALGAFVTSSPPLVEQRCIASFLDRETAKIDALVAEQERLIELVKEKRRALISHTVARGANSHAPQKASGIEWLRDVPEHWEIVRLANIFREVAESGSDGLPILSVSIHHGVSDRELEEQDLDRKVTRSDDRSKYKRVSPGDLVYNMMRAWQGAFGTVGVEGLVSPAYVVARPRRKIATAYVELLLRTPRAIEQMRRYSHGVTDFRLRLYWEEFKNIKIALPPDAEADAICQQIALMDAEFDAVTAVNEESIALLKERRVALISAAVTGKIDVRGLADAKAA